MHILGNQEWGCARTIHERWSLKSMFILKINKNKKQIIWLHFLRVRYDFLWKYSIDTRTWQLLWENSIVVRSRICTRKNYFLFYFFFDILSQHTIQNMYNIFQCFSLSISVDGNESLSKITFLRFTQLYIYFFCD